MKKTYFETNQERCDTLKAQGPSKYGRQSVLLLAQNSVHVCTEYQQHPVYYTVKSLLPLLLLSPYFNFFGEKKSPPVERNNMMMVKNSQMLYRAKHRRKSPIKKVATIMSSTTQYYNIQHILGDRRWPSGNSNPFFREKKNSTYDTSRKLATIYGRESWVLFT